jgi:DNA-directed RNA polymerase specialized sigma24 family protein
VLKDRIQVEAFTEFVSEAEPKLRNALCAAFGGDRGREATADALAFAWEHWDRVQAARNPMGYLWGVGRNKARRYSRKTVGFPPPPPAELPWVEPGLSEALTRLSEKQRVAVMLVHGLEWSLSEASEVLGLSKSTVQHQAERGLARLRRTLGAEQ